MNPEPDSPYAPPMSEVGRLVDATTLATTGRRFLTYLIDSAVILVLQGSIVGRFIPPRLQATSFSAYVATYVLVFVYYVTLESLFGRTLGKLVAGTRVVREDRGPPSFSQILGRSAARLIPFDQLSAIATRFPRPWHDSLSGTRVIRIR
jgi:uncharacterized RDD family membrane protein YckC